MSDYGVVITQAGLNAAVSAGVKIEITHIAVGTSGYTPTRSRKALASEVARVQIAGGEQVSENQWHVTADFTEGEFAAREVGFFLSDGTLFAVWSHPTNVLFYKTALGRVAQGFDLTLEGVPAENITVQASGDLSFYYAPEFINVALGSLRHGAAVIKQAHWNMQISEKMRLGGL